MFVKRWSPKAPIEGSAGIVREAVPEVGPAIDLIAYQPGNPPYDPAATLEVRIKRKNGNIPPGVAIADFADELIFTRSLDDAFSMRPRATVQDQEGSDIAGGFDLIRTNEPLELAIINGGVGNTGDFLIIFTG